MNASLLDRRSRWRLSVAVSGSGSGTYPGYTHSHSGQIRSWNAVDAEEEDLAVKILVTSDTSTGERVATLDIPRLGITHTETVSGAGSMAAYVEIEGHAVHVFGIATSDGLHPAWRVEWTAIKFYVQGSLVQTWTSGWNEQSAVELFFQPSSILITGGPPHIEPFASFGASGGLPETSSYDHSATGSCSVTGGWSFEPVGHGSLIERPVSLMPLASVDQSGNPWTLGGSAYAAGSQSGSITVYAYYFQRDKRTIPPSSGAGDVFTEWEHYKGAVRIFTVEERKLRRLSGSYRALLQRYGFPRTKSVTTVTESNIDVIGGLIGDPYVVSTNSGEFELTPERTDMLRIVGAAEDSVFEDVLGFTPYAPVTVQHKKGQLSYTLNVTVVPNPPFGDLILVTQGDGSGTEVVYEAGYQCQDRIANPDLPAFLDHRHSWVRAWNMLAHPFWSMAYHFPTNTATYWRPVEGIDVKTFDWPEDDEVGYWMPVYSQWLTHPALPEGERRRTRNSIRTNLLQEAPFARWWKSAAFGSPLHPLGICRFAVESPAVPASLAMSSASSSLWTSTDCILTHGASMSVAFSASPAVIELDLGSWTGQHRMYPHLANEIEVAWNSSNVASITVEFVGVDGSVVQLATAPGSYLRPVGPATKFSGSWAKDHSADTAVADTGADIGANGISTATMSSPERSLAPQLLPGRGAQKLRFTITPVSTGSPVTISYPIFKKPTGKARVVPLDHQHTALVFERGPGLLLGTLDSWDRTDNVDTGATPNLSIWARRIMDVFTYQKLKNYLFLGKDADDLLDSRLAALYDSVEGQARVDAAYDTMAIPIGIQDGIKWILHNSWQIPPMAAFPHKRRDTITLELKSPLELTNEVYDWAEENRYYPSPATISVDQFSPPDSWTALSPHSVDGWKILYDAHPVTNDEANDFRVIYKGEDLSTVSPWFGYLCIHDFDEAGGVAMASCLQTGSLYAIVFGDGVRVVRLRPFPAGQYDIPSLISENVASAGITLSPDGKILVSYVGSSDGTYLLQSGGNETLWESPVTIDPNGESTAIEANPSGKECAIASYHAGAWHLYVRWDETKAFELVGPIVTAPLGHAGLTWQTSGSLMIVFGYSDGAETRFLRSGDYGLNWEAV